MLAIFMGGLGLGAAILGKRSDTHPHPLAFYGALEEVRRLAYVAAAWRNGRCGTRTIGALSALEPHALSLKPILELRALCYRDARLFDLAERARLDLEKFENAEESISQLSSHAMAR